MKQLDDFIEELKQILGKKLDCVAIFGSKANYGLQKVTSNVDLLIIINSLTLEDLTSIAPAITKWTKGKNRYPVIVTKEEFYTSNDICALEYFDIQWNYQIVFGEDLIKNHTIGYNDLKRQCIRELKMLILKYRNYYAVYYKNKREIKEALVRLISTCLVVFRVVLRLQNISPSVYKNDLIDQFNSIIPIDKRLFKRLLAQKEKTYDLPNYALQDCSSLVLNELSKVLKQVAAM